MAQTKVVSVKSERADSKAGSVKKVANVPLTHGVGRRKKSVARAWLRRGNGKVVVNGLPHEKYFDTALTRDEVMRAFQACPVGANYSVQVNVCGGGKNGQADATKLAIARAFVSIDESLRSALRKEGLLTVDSRVKERKKYGQRGARAKFQFVKR